MKHSLITIMNICRNNTSKALLSIMFLFLVSTGFAQRYIQQYPGLRSNWTAVDFADANNGMVIGNDVSNKIARTTDGGATWVYANTNPYHGIYLAMGSVSNALTCTGDPWLYRTTNDGISWLSCAPDLYVSYYDVSMFGGSLGVSIGSLSLEASWVPAIYKTTNGGLSWDTTIIVGYNPRYGSRVSLGSALNGVACLNSYTSNGFFYRTSDGGKTWSPGNVDTTLLIAKKWFPYSVKMINANVGYSSIFIQTATGIPSTLILKTIDGGQNWKQCNTTTNFPSTTNGYSYASLSFINEKTGGALFEGKLFITQDSGKTWVEKSIPPAGFIGIKFVSEQVIVLVGGVITRSTDGGNTWTSNTAYNYGPGAATVSGMAMNDAGIGVAVDFGSSIARTMDSGNTWYNIPIPILNASASVRGIKFAADSIVVALVDSGRYLRSSDTGKSWGLFTISGFPDYTVHFPDYNVHFLKNTGFGIMAGSNGTFARTFDYGVTWEVMPSISGQKVRQILIHKSDHVYIYACGDSGTVVRSDDYGSTWSAMNNGLSKIITVYSLSTMDDQTILVSADSGNNVSGYWNKVYRYQKNEGVWHILSNDVTKNHSKGTIGTIIMLSPSTILVRGTGNSEEGKKIYVSSDAGSSWLAEKYFGSGINDIYDVVSPADIYLGINYNQIWRRIQGDYPTLSDVDFGPVSFAPAKSKHEVIEIINTGTDTITVSDIYFKDGSLFSLVAPIVTRIPPGVTFFQTIKFSPTESGPREDALIIVSNSLSYPNDTIIVKGTGTSDLVEITTNENVLDYGSVHYPNDSLMQFWIHSTGFASLHVNNISLQKGKTEYSILNTQTTNLTILPNDSLQVDVRFTPRDTGFVIDSVKIESDAQTNNPAYVKLIGYGKKPIITYAINQHPYKVDFGTVLVSQTKEEVVLFTNSGNDFLEISSVHLSGDIDGVFKITADPQGHTLAPGQVDSMKARYEPVEEKSSIAKISVSPFTLSTDTIFLQGIGKKTSAVGDEKLPQEFSFLQNYPNPFTRATLIRYQLQAGANKGVIEISDMLGHIVQRTPVDNLSSQIIFDAASLPGGVYTCSLVTQGVRISKMISYIP